MAAARRKSWLDKLLGSFFRFFFFFFFFLQQTKELESTQGAKGVCNPIGGATI
jgi:hypothetical protein